MQILYYKIYTSILYHYTIQLNFVLPGHLTYGHLYYPETIW